MPYVIITKARATGSLAEPGGSDFIESRRAVATLEEAIDGQRGFIWTVAGESYREGSSNPWRPEEHSGLIAAESAGEALEKIVSGLGEGTTLENTIPWDVIDQDREITITIRPLELPESGGTVGPLPDGTVIEVKPASYDDLYVAARLVALGTPDLEEGRRQILDVFNAREART